MIWKEKTCENCKYIKNEWCKKHPMGLKKTDVVKVEGEQKWVTVYIDACSEYSEEV